MTEGRAADVVRGRRGEDGFSLIELLVVCLIIGALAAIAIPLFLSQPNKANDASAKELARTAETTAESIATDNDGSYETVTTTELHNNERTIPLKGEGQGAYLSGAKSARNEYSLTVKATDGDEFTITKSPGGAISRTCKSTKGNCAQGTTGSW